MGKLYDLCHGRAVKGGYDQACHPAGNHVLNGRCLDVGVALAKLDIYLIPHFCQVFCQILLVLLGPGQILGGKGYADDLLF